MRIAFCLENFNPARGGAEQYVADLSHRLCRHGHHIHVFTLSSNCREEENLYLHLLKVPPRPRFLKTLSFAIACQRQVARQGFDIVHSFGRSWGMDIFQPLGGSQMASLVGNIRSIDSIPARMIKILSYVFSLRRLTYFLVEGIQMKSARTIVAISAMVKKDLLHYIHLNPERVKIVRNGVDLQKFHPRNRAIYREEIRQKLGLREENILILFVAHNFRLKGLHPLIRALSLLRRDHPERVLFYVRRGYQNLFLNVEPKW